jgi:hypothetical protein
LKTVLAHVVVVVLAADRLDDGAEDDGLRRLERAPPAALAAPEEAA